MIIRRAFADLAHGQMHYRHAGEGAFAGGVDALLVLHPSPVSSRQMVRMVEGLAPLGRVIAPDTAGCGDSDPLPQEVPAITDYAAALRDLMDALGLGRVLVYGMHTGAAIAAELAILAPDRVAGVVIDGLSDFHGEGLEEVLTHYAPPFPADLDGAGLARLFQFCRDQFLFFPWYARSGGARRDTGLPPPDDLYGWVGEVLKARGSYARAYHAAFRWRGRERLPLVACPMAITCGANDPLYAATDSVAHDAGMGLRPLPRFDAPDYAAARRDLILALVPPDSGA
ncbi:MULTISPECIES: alpha/beta fold hydrolase [unclassified Novosphingobium]|uniref:alpha/beta fold hydrolase n=1 Tax=unclassified Novosphingobium TaxID=2644732 RepID=UPI000A68D951|nr:MULTISPECIES: alpha/beta hydrolase [unclassified Novosphingobium]MDR6707266.1 pimeloyl-ACP methyl ester carboxylesterase [Novosphingobium sp. 1748]